MHIRHPGNRPLGTTRDCCGDFYYLLKYITVVRVINALILFCAFAPLSLNAQTFTDHLQQNVAGQGTVTVEQSAEISSLVNGASKPVTQTLQTHPTTKAATTKATPAQNHSEAHSTTTATHNVAEKHEAAVRPVRTENSTRTEAKPQHPTTTRSTTHQSATQRNDTSNNDNDGMSIPVVDMRKKIMRHAVKVTGYRVQVWAGGNSRADRQKAESIGNNIKLHFPDQPVYVHFYSPRWLCRMGNFRSMQQAQSMLRAVKRLGYSQAILVKGKITVQE